MATSRAATAIAVRQMELRDSLWPNAEELIWNRRTKQGFTTIPKTMPLILKIMDEMSKGKPLSATYLSIWCSTWDNSFLTGIRPKELALAAGFSGQRAEYTWATRVKILADLCFIDIKPGKSGPLSNILVFNPHSVIRRHYEMKSPGLVEASYNMLIERSLEIGARDMSAPGVSVDNTSQAEDEEG